MAPVNPDILLAHHWLVARRGGERVFSLLASLFPGAPIATLVSDPHKIPDDLHGRPIFHSPLQSIPFVRKRFRALVPLHPWAVRRITIPFIPQFVLSSDAAFIKSLPLPPDTPHVCYCHTPPRYIWGLEDTYLGKGLRRRLAGPFLPPLRRADREAAGRVTAFIANSQHVRARIRACYDRDAEVVHPPVATEAFVAPQTRDDFYAVVSQLVPYKRIEWAAAACSQLGRRLVVIGEGPGLHRLRTLYPQVEWLGWQPDAVVRDHLARARALLFPGEEDFGIVPLEAMAAGTPVIAWARGGVLETVIDGVTGHLYADAGPDAVASAIRMFEAGPAPDPEACRRRAAEFSESVFLERIRSILSRWPASGLQ
jgi:glycosyltransferase involved in cell wall biosynthesis